MFSDKKLEQLKFNLKGRKKFSLLVFGGNEIVDLISRLEAVEAKCVRHKSALEKIAARSCSLLDDCPACISKEALRD